MAAPSSAQTIPSHRATSAPSSHPSIACGPFILASRIGIVMNGPTPIISSMLAAVAPAKPMPRTRCGDSDGRDCIGYYTGTLRRNLFLVTAAICVFAQSPLERAVTLARERRYAEARKVLAGVAEPEGVQ